MGGCVGRLLHQIRRTSSPPYHGQQYHQSQRTYTTSYHPSSTFCRQLFPPLDQLLDERIEVVGIGGGVRFILIQSPCHLRYALPAIFGEKSQPFHQRSFLVPGKFHSQCARFLQMIRWYSPRRFLWNLSSDTVINRCAQRINISPWSLL